MEKKRSFEVTIADDNGNSYVAKGFVTRPTNEVLKSCDIYRAKVWNKCIIEGVLTKKELQKVLKERGIYGDDKIKEEEEIIRQIQDCEKKLYLGDGSKKMKLSDGKKIALQMKRLRASLRDLISEKIALEENTAENIADNARFDYLVALCTFKEDGSRAFSGIDDYNQQSSDTFAFKAAATLAEMMYQLDTNMENSLPENKWLRSFNLVDDNLNLVKDGHLVDSEGRKIGNDGYYIDDNGNRVDRDGNPLDENGNYVLKVQYEDDDEVKPSKKK